MLRRRQGPEMQPAHGFNISQGFSILELMITLTLMAIISALAVPSYQHAVEKRRITSGAESIAAFVSTIQTESIKRNRAVRVSYSTGAYGSWCIGAENADEHSLCDCMKTEPEAGFCAIGAVPRSLKDSDVQANNLVTSQPATGLTFLNR